MFSFIGSFFSDPQDQISDDELGINEELRFYVSHIAHLPEVWIEFPVELFAVEDTNWKQETHVERILQKVPEVGELKDVLVPDKMTEEKFWSIYFGLSRNKIGSRFYQKDKKPEENDQIETQHEDVLKLKIHNENNSPSIRRKAKKTDPFREAVELLQESESSAESANPSEIVEFGEKIEAMKQISGFAFGSSSHSSKSFFASIFEDNLSLGAQSKHSLDVNDCQWDSDGLLDKELYQKVVAPFVEDEPKHEAKLSCWKAVIDQISTHPSADFEKKLKYLLFGGVPDAFRSQVWKRLVGANSVLEKHKNVYNSVLKRCYHSTKIPSRTRFFPNLGGGALSNYQFLTKKGRDALKRVLVVIAIENPSLDFAPIVQNSAALFLHFLNEEETYVASQLLISKWSVEKSSTKLFLGYKALATFLFVFSDLVEVYLTPLFKHMKLIQVSIVEIAYDWFSRIFISALPFPIVLHIFEVYLRMGLKVLLRVAFSLLSSFSATLLTTTDKMSFITHLNTCLSGLQEAESIIMGRPPYTHDDLNLFFTKNVIRSKNLADLVPDPPVYYSPVVNTSSSIMHEEMFELLWAWIPNRYGMCNPQLAFATDKHGFRLATIYQKCANIEPTILVIKTPTAVFGAYLSESWKKVEGAYGTGETFLFILKPLPTIYRWKPDFKEYFIMSEKNSILVGGGVNGPGLWLDDELDWGRSEKCDTFYNLPLNGDQSTTFQILAVEVFSLVK